MAPGSQYPQMLAYPQPHILINNPVHPPIGKEVFPKEIYFRIQPFDDFTTSKGM